MCARRRRVGTAATGGDDAGPPPRYEGCSAWKFAWLLLLLVDLLEGVRHRFRLVQYPMMQPDAIAWSSFVALICTYTAVSYVNTDGGQARCAKISMAHRRIFQSSTHGSTMAWILSFILPFHPYAIAVVRYDASKSHIVGSIRRPRRLPRLVVDRRRSAGQHSWEAAAESAAYAK